MNEISCLLDRKVKGMRREALIVSYYNMNFFIFGIAPLYYKEIAKRWLVVKERPKVLTALGITKKPFPT